MNTLIKELIEEYRNENSLFYSQGVPEVPFKIESAVSLRHGRFLLASNYIAYCVYYSKFGRLLLPVVVAFRRDERKFIRFGLGTPELWTPPGDSKDLWRKEFIHDCACVVIDKKGYMRYPEYVLDFPYSLRCGKVLVLHGRASQRCRWTYITIDGQKLHHGLDRLTQWSVLSMTEGTTNLLEVVSEQL